MNTLSHVAIIMDGNGRWAERQGKKRSFGHDKGAQVVREITRSAAKIGIKYLTLYAFSTENWKRPKYEIEYLMKLFMKFLKQEQKSLMENNIRFETIGDLSKFSHELRNTIENVKESTKNNNALTQVLAVNYGSHDEITRACQKLFASGAQITQANIEASLDTKDFPPVDLLIRTGGERRLSNFLLWQASYAELFFTKTLWPDFAEAELIEIISEYKNIQRKFGGV
ncbi:MAG: di-trans,poly-cis-decaprenylcistransferase [Campylobacteraceae bacterium]|nr:di-trans,poly-cis-decaprenylcistransferase [Campylobacteraceae bacterium]